jgi:hypothetical protein
LLKPRHDEIIQTISIDIAHSTHEDTASSNREALGRVHLIKHNRKVHSTRHRQQVGRFLSVHDVRELCTVAGFVWQAADDDVLQAITIDVTKRTQRHANE